MKNKKILITGGAGFIGSNLAAALQEKYPGNDYFIIDDLSSGARANIKSFKGSVITGDISELNLNNYFPNGLDVIFHQAAITDTTISDEKKMMKVNVDGFKNILSFALKNKSKLVYASSAAVYGRSLPPMRVGKNEKPTNVYGSSKLMADNIARKHFKDITVIGLRYFNVYGPKEEYKKKMASMIWQLYLQMKDKKMPRIFKNGEQKRDQVYVKDVVRANLLALEKDKSGIFNIGTGKATTFNEIVKCLNKTMGSNFQPEYFDNPYNYYQDHTEADLTEAKNILGYYPEYDIEKGIDDYLKNIK